MEDREVSSDMLRELLMDPTYLPSREDIVTAFGEYGTPSYDHNAWVQFVRQKDKTVYEVLTREYINALSSYLLERAEEYGFSPDNPMTIVETGAGDGRLSNFLKKSLQEKVPNMVRIIATDSGDWDIREDSPVEHLDYETAIEKYQPDIIITSWMPPGTDWTAGYRKADSVKEYILIGNADGNRCGDEWNTWGSASAAPTQDATAPYQADGFSRYDLTDMTALQISGNDFPGRYRTSKTVSFKRE